MRHPDLRRATMFSGRFCVYTSGRASVTWSRQSTCVVQWTACSSSSLSSTGTRPSFRGVSSPSQMPSSTASSPPQPYQKPRSFELASWLRSACFKLSSLTWMPERKTWLTRASLLWVIGGVSTKQHPTPRQLEALSAGDRGKISMHQSKWDATGEV
eukprot:234669-Pleurochrysis_carterae.AAC.1